MSTFFGGVFSSSFPFEKIVGILSLVPFLTVVITGFGEEVHPFGGVMFLFSAIIIFSSDPRLLL